MLPLASKRRGGRLPGEPGVRLLEEALHALPETDSALRPGCWQVWLTLSFTGRREQAVAVAQQSIAMARRLADPRTWRLC